MATYKALVMLLVVALACIVAGKRISATTYRRKIRVDCSAGDDLDSVSGRRVALCVSGQVRDNWQDAMRSFADHVYPNSSVDAFLCIDVPSDPRVDNDVVAQSYGTLFNRVTHTAVKVGDGDLVANLSPGHSSYVYKIFTCNQLVARSTNVYDVVIHVRPDIVFNGPFCTRVPDVRTVYSPFLRPVGVDTLSPEGHAYGHGVVTDQLFYGTSDTMQALIEAMYNSGRSIRSPEQLLTATITESSLRIKYVPMDVLLVRGHAPSEWVRKITTGTGASFIPTMIGSGFHIVMCISVGIAVALIGWLWASRFPVS